MAVPDETGTYQPGQILLPAGKKPLILSQVPVHYTTSLANDGFARRLVVPPADKLPANTPTPRAKPPQAPYDLVSVLEAFLAQHPDFSYRGARAVLGISGDPGPWGTTSPDETERASARKVAQSLLNTGYEFASFTLRRHRLWRGIRRGSGSGRQAVERGSGAGSGTCEHPLLRQRQRSGQL